MKIDGKKKHEREREREWEREREKMKERERERDRQTDREYLKYYGKSLAALRVTHLREYLRAQKYYKKLKMNIHTWKFSNMPENFESILEIIKSVKQNNC